MLLQTLERDISQEEVSLEQDCRRCHLRVAVKVRQCSPCLPTRPPLLSPYPTHLPPIPPPTPPLPHPQAFAGPVSALATSDVKGMSAIFMLLPWQHTMEVRTVTWSNTVMSLDSFVTLSHHQLPATLLSLDTILLPHPPLPVVVMCMDQSTAFLANQNTQSCKWREGKNEEGRGAEGRGEVERGGEREGRGGVERGGEGSGGDTVRSLVWSTHCSGESS